jgi:hypothetical protein
VKISEALTAAVTRRAALAEIAPGRRVCIVGVGMDNLVHTHGAVQRTTRTLIIVKTDKGTERRYRKDDGGSTPYSQYGGTSIHLTCQRPKEK